jgi:hypothetical protein
MRAGAAEAAMQAYKVETTLSEDGTLVLTHLPFRAGDRLEVIILGEPKPEPADRYPLRGAPLRYDDPTEPVAGDDWEASR